MSYVINQYEKFMRGCLLPPSNTLQHVRNWYYNNPIVKEFGGLPNYVRKQKTEELLYKAVNNINSGYKQEGLEEIPYYLYSIYFELMEVYQPDEVFGISIKDFKTLSSIQICEKTPFNKLLPAFDKPLMFVIGDGRILYVIKDKFDQINKMRNIIWEYLPEDSVTKSGLPRYFEFDTDCTGRLEQVEEDYKNCNSRLARASDILKEPESEADMNTDNLRFLINFFQVKPELLYVKDEGFNRAKKGVGDTSYPIFKFSHLEL